MCKYFNRRSLLLVILTTFAGLEAGCEDSRKNENSYRNEPFPVQVTVVELASNYENLLGRRVVVAGQLEMNDGFYSLVPGLTGDSAPEPSSAKFRLAFLGNKPSKVSMARCMIGNVFVNGVVMQDDSVDVKFVQLEEDVLAYRADACYQHFE